jgi:hypothetical protein
MQPCRRRAIYALQKASEPKQPEAFFMPQEAPKPERKKRGNKPDDAKSKNRH